MAKARGKTDLETELRGLHHGPLGEFTAARNALAKQLDRSGDKDAAAEVKSLPKPSVSAWAVNRLFEREPAKMEALLKAGEHARAGLKHAISGHGVEALRDALDAERAARDDLRRRASALIEEDSGRKPSAAILDRVSTNLDSLALSPESADFAARGWINADLAPPGFEVLSGMPLTGTPRQRPSHLRLVPATKEKKAEPEKKAGPTLREQREEVRVESARQREEEAERRKREREEELRRERLARLEQKAAEIRAEAEAARREADRADKVVEEAERALEEARRRLGNAQDDAKRSRQRADRAAERLERAEKDLKSG